MHIKYDLKVPVVSIPKISQEYSDWVLAVRVCDLIQQIVMEDGLTILLGKVSRDHSRAKADLAATSLLSFPMRPKKNNCLSVVSEYL